jgi:hypothetical protein
VAKVSEGERVRVCAYVAMRVRVCARVRVEFGVQGLMGSGAEFSRVRD